MNKRRTRSIRIDDKTWDEVCHFAKRTGASSNSEMITQFIHTGVNFINSDYSVPTPGIRRLNEIVAGDKRLVNIISTLVAEIRSLREMLFQFKSGPTYFRKDK